MVQKRTLGRRQLGGGLLLAMGCLLVPLPAQGSVWSMQGYQFRKRVVLDKMPPGAPACHVRFTHHGALLRDGRDIRVTNASGREVPYELLRLGPGDQAEILFHCKGAQKGNAYVVYFGSKRAPPPKLWQAKAGVVMEVRKKGQGGCDSWAQYQRLFENSKEVLGKALRPKIFDGYNPLGPSQNIVAYYRAYFQTGRKGIHKFATTSDDASFLLVNGRMVAQYPGWHGAWPGRWGQHNGTIRLDPGVHKLEYYHVQGDAEMTTVAGWQRPGDRHVRLMTEEAFVPVAQGRAQALDRADRRPALDFTWTPVDHLVVDGRYLIRYNFECGSRYSGDLHWDFGDGSTATVKKGNSAFSGRHLFLGPGRHTVQVRPSAESSFAPARQTVVVEPVWLQQEEFQESRWKEYQGLARKRLEEGTVRPDDVAALLVYAAELQEGELLKLAAARAWKVADRLTEKDHAWAFFTLGLHLQRNLRDYEGADRAYQEVLKRTGEKTYRERAKLHRAGLLIHVLGRYQEALHMLKKTDATALKPPNEPVLQKIYIADALAGLGRREEAVLAYERLRNVVPLTNRKYAASRRARLVAIESYIRRGELESALQELDNIEWETPKERMTAETGLLRAECFLAQKDYQRAVTLLDRLLKINPTSARVPEMLFMRIKAYRGMKRKDKVGETYARLKKEFPYAEQTALAARWLGK